MTDDRAVPETARRRILDEAIAAVRTTGEHWMRGIVSGQSAVDLIVTALERLRDAPAPRQEPQEQTQAQPPSAPPPFTADKFTPARAAFLAKELRTTGCFELADMANCLASPLAEIATERKRQKAVEGWTEAHDDGHRDRELAYAAACYAIALGDKDSEPRLWPWQRSWWKPKDQRSNLIRAAALLLAEIERLDRASLLNGAAQ